MRILYVEDDRLLKEIMTEILISKGYDTDSASNGLEALQILKKNDYDIIILDLQMPFMNGMETAKNILEKATVKKPVIILMSGDKIYRNQYSEIGINDYLQKPFSIPDLQSILLKWENNINQIYNQLLCEV